jgi:hypothetical protein
MHCNFYRELINNPTNEGTYFAGYLEPNGVFLSELDITNNGYIFPAHGPPIHLPEPFGHGFLQSVYRVLETTNQGGLIFPRRTQLISYFLSPHAKSPGDVFPVMVSTLSVDEIDLGEHSAVLSPVPKILLAMDTRPVGLKEDMTVDYLVTNDYFTPVTNHMIEQIATIVRAEAPPPSPNSKPRFFFLGLLAVLAVTPLVVMLRKNSQTKNEQQKIK